MRQNGLRASSFVPVVDADPRVCDSLLDLLRLADVAAYSEPSPGMTGVYRDHHVASRRLDRLWVDRDETSRAREVLDRALPHLQAELEVAIRDGIPVNAEAFSSELLEHGAGTVGKILPGAEDSRLPPVAGVVPVGTPPATVDGAEVEDVVPAERGAAQLPARPPVVEPDDAAVERAWAAIVADFDTPAAGPTPWPATEELSTSRVPRLRRSPRPSPAMDRSDLDPDTDHFVPPPPPDLPRLDPMARIGWAAVIAGPIVLVLVVVFGQSLPGWVPLLGVFTLVGGFALLVSRLRPTSSDDESDHHDGAVV